MCVRVFTCVVALVVYRVGYVRIHACSYVGYAYVYTPTCVVVCTLMNVHAYAVDTLVGCTCDFVCLYTYVHAGFVYTRACVLLRSCIIAYIMIYILTIVVIHMIS